jgi:predicted nucleic acid-binding protein
MLSFVPVTPMKNRLTADTFLDTNVLIYAFVRSAPSKQKIARELLAQMLLR